MTLIPRSAWGARYAKGSAALGATKGVTLHWEGPHMGTFPHDRCAEKVRGIERFHAVDRGWAGIAYNYLVCPHGYVFEGRGAGVRSAANGNTQTNNDWYAVCYLGGEGDSFTAEGQQGMREAVRICRSNGAGPLVNGHRDHKPTACPGDTIYRWLRAEDFDLPARHDLKPTTEGDDDMWLDDAINVHDPAGRAETQQVTGRELLTALAIFLNSQPGPHQAYLEAARKSKVE